jgi:hypothetical protein
LVLGVRLDLGDFEVVVEVVAHGDCAMMIVMMMIMMMTDS